MLFDINDDEVLAKISRYELVRKAKNRRLHIDVYQIVAGAQELKYMAVSKSTEGRSSADNYWGFGDTELDALQECLSRIKDRTVDDIIPPAKDTEKHATTARISRKLYPTT